MGQKTDKKKIFTTIDGKDIFDGDPFYVVNDKHQILDRYAREYMGMVPGFKYFSTKKAAESYIKNTKPTKNKKGDA
jgi:hypothetical protein